MEENQSIETEVWNYGLGTDFIASLSFMWLFNFYIMIILPKILKVYHKKIKTKIIFLCRIDKHKFIPYASPTKNKSSIK
jgi:hypothetical protein